MKYFSMTATLGEACGKTGWRIHAYVLMGNHFHFVLETPQPNLCLGMKWLSGIFTQRWNRRRNAWDHLFGGRYKAQRIDERSPEYLRTACDYVHLNRAWAGLVRAGEALETYPWCSYPPYLRPRLRPDRLRTDRLLGGHGLDETQRGARRQFARPMRVQQGESTEEAPPALLRDSRLGAEDFAARLANKLGRRERPSERARERRETDEQRAEVLLDAGLKTAGWTKATLEQTAKGHPPKVCVARGLRASTPMTRAWIAERLKMGSASYLSALLSVESKN